jgi:hypothetical protein
MQLGYRQVSLIETHSGLNPSTQMVLCCTYGESCECCVRLAWGPYLGLDLKPEGLQILATLAQAPAGAALAYNGP